MRAQLDPEKTVRENVSEGSDHVTIGGAAQARHRLSRRFSVSAGARQLAGGESCPAANATGCCWQSCSRNPANLLVLDEPTNDLDVETLELLEELLAEFTGTLLLVSHDRAFIDNVVTSMLAFEGDGAWGEYVGGYQDWLRQKRVRGGPRPPAAAPQRPTAPKPGAAKKRLSYKEQRELDAMPQTIDALEAEQRALQQRIADPAFYRQDKTAIAVGLAALDSINDKLATAYARWEQLDAGS